MSENLHIQAIEGLVGKFISVESLYETLTQQGWKIDLEESDLMVGMSKTWDDLGLKVWIYLEEFVCAPPYGEEEVVQEVFFGRFDPSIPRVARRGVIAPGHTLEEVPEEYHYIYEHGDPFYGVELDRIPFTEVPEALLAEVATALSAVERT